MLQNILYNPRRQSLSPERIVETVAKYYGVPSDQLRGKARDKQIVLPRQIAMYLMREETESPLLRIGEASAAATTRPSSTAARRSSARCRRTTTSGGTSTRSASSYTRRSASIRASSGCG